MGVFDVSLSQTIETEKDINTASTLFQQSIQEIGTYLDTQYISSNEIVIKGKSKYGLQKIPLKIHLKKIDDSTTKILIEGQSDDAAGIGAKKCIQRLITMYQKLATSDLEELQYIEDTSPFENKTGFTKTKLFLYLAGFIIVLAVFINVFKNGGGSNNSSIIGGPRQSPLDNSVDCVESYLKLHYLRDPDSYQSVSWSKITKNNDGTYHVTHTFRAKNGFGGMGVETKSFTISSDGWTVLNVY